MSQPSTFGGRPHTPPPGASVPELLVARFRSQARRLSWCAIVLIAVAGATGYLYGNLPAPFEDWMLLLAAGLVVVAVVILPFLLWLSRLYTITNRRVIARWGLVRRQQAELPHARGYTISVRRGPLQRLFGAGTIVLKNGIDAPLRLVNVPSATLVQETLGDQIEVGQILAHRDEQASSGLIPTAPTEPTEPQAR
ncbi:MAG: PH domain-containing protein [Microbacteriaceae bacterium]|nr:PH domain-containing protein [Microbacteriaceae bacterium]HOA86128.1 PH domain-containing protein [Microbacteriaceae bacterium]HPZ34610.1 PH domain-containing protein [Microbacteriaceae bacterium]HQC92371.1 PH domain-containing protein [Microbacteriaceae bacterium]